MKYAIVWTVLGMFIGFSLSLTKLEEIETIVQKTRDQITYMCPPTKHLSK